MNLRKRWRLFRAIWLQAWHEHRCLCGTTWHCSRTACEATFSVCATCEARQMDQWIADFEARERARKGAA